MRKVISAYKHAIVFALSVVSQHALGETKPAGRIVGLGATTCSQFMEDVERNPAIQRDYLAWTQGYMSGVLLGRPGTVDSDLNLAPSTFPLRKQLEFLRDYCTSHSNENFPDAVDVLYKTLRGNGAT